MVDFRSEPGQSGMLLPPHSIEAEQTLIGRVLLDNDRWDDASRLVVEADFYRREHRLIWAAIGELIEAGKPADALTVIEHLTARGMGKEIDLQYLAALWSNAVSPQNAVHFAKVVRDRARLRKLAATCTEILDRCYVPGVDFDELSSRAEEALLGMATPGASGEPMPLGEALRQAMLRVDDLHSRGGGLAGISTGFADLDRMTLGFCPGDLIILGARTSKGKTTLGINIAQWVERAHGTVAVFSLEMSAVQLAMRVLSEQSRVPMDRVRSGRIVDDEWERVNEAFKRESASRIVIDECSSATVAQMRARLRKIKRQRGLEFVVVDYLQLVQGKGQNREQEVSSVSRGLKAIAMEFSVPVLCLAQLSRQVEHRADRRPVVADLRESGAIEQDADTILLLHQDDWQRNVNYAELIIGKQRNGPLGSIGLAHFHDHLRFENWSGPAPQPPVASSSRTGVQHWSKGFDAKSAAAGRDA